MARVAWKTSSESFPKSGNRELSLLLNFSAQAVILDDLSPEMRQSEIETIQSIFIDNSANPAPFTIQFFPSNQIILVQAFNQGIFPVINWGALSYKASTAQGIQIPVIFSNTAKSFSVWGPAPGVTVVPALTNIPINLAPSNAGDNIIVPAVALQTIKVYRMILGFGAGTNVEFASNPTLGNPLTGAFPLFAGGSLTMEPSGIPWFTTGVGQSLNMNTSNAVNVGGILGYVQS